jgi:hypothetical protein
VPVGAAQKAAVAAHAAARGATDAAAIAAARACGHAVATAHMAEHALGVCVYGRKAVEAAGQPADAERAWQVAQLPDAVKALVVSALGNGRFVGR